MKEIKDIKDTILYKVYLKVNKAPLWRLSKLKKERILISNELFSNTVCVQNFAFQSLRKVGTCAKANYAFAMH